jgi:hypothetical protein
MSVFVVNLNNLVQGRLDMDPSTDPVTTYGDLGTPFTVSNQRQIYVAGPKRAYRLLKDGETFTDCNYWKQFTIEGGCDPARAFVHLHSDDGTIWSDVAEENTYGIGGTGTTLISGEFSLLLAEGYVDFMATYGQAARFLQVSNTNGSAVSLVGELNGDTNVTFTLVQNATQVFNVGELAITKLRLKSATAATCNFTWLASIMTPMNS